LGGVIWMLENPRTGLREPDEIDHQTVLEVAFPYLGELSGSYSDWPSVEEQAPIPSSVIGADCPWQFGRFRVP
jgi:homospermidine synthase